MLRVSRFVKALAKGVLDPNGAHDGKRKLHRERPPGRLPVSV